MKVSKIIIKNIMGIKELEVAPGVITEVKGSNGEGKTSILEAISSVISGGHSASLLRNGETKGETVIELDDGTQITKKVNANTSSVEVKKDSFVMQSPQSFIKQLFGSGFNIINFLTMDKKERLAETLKLVPLEITKDKLEEITKVKIPDGALDYSEHGLKVLEKARVAIYDARKGYNAITKDANNTATSLENALGDVPDNVDAEIDKVQAEIDKLEALVNAEKAKLLSLNATKAKANQIESTRKQIEDAKKKAKDNEEYSMNADRALERIDAFKKEQISKLELAGMKISISDGEVCFDDIPYSRINHAKQVEIAFALAQHTLGDVRFVIADGAESLDSNTMESVRLEAVKNNVQLILLSVDECPLTVSTGKTDDNPF